MKLLEIINQGFAVFYVKTGTKGMMSGENELPKIFWSHKIAKSKIGILPSPYRIQEIFKGSALVLKL